MISMQTTAPAAPTEAPPDRETAPLPAIPKPATPAQPKPTHIPHKRPEHGPEPDVDVPTIHPTCPLV